MKISLEFVEDQNWFQTQLGLRFQKVLFFKMFQIIYFIHENHFPLSPTEK